MAELVFFTGTMDCGKSTLALQMDHNHAARGRAGLVFSQHDRGGQSMLSSRLGLSHDAIEVEEHLDNLAAGRLPDLATSPLVSAWGRRRH